ncbi:hypothetical protein C8D87_1165 [Lentzea atacamensis]|uniref:DUF4209 domain-containing protein n=1 Tax=Lentzea atacamensis TaxID=531938 RepID=A0ABX9DV54_9PSEU|nr:hypothetical protein C8D87_1165 [Lentzea atacamensis]
MQRPAAAVLFHTFLYSLYCEEVPQAGAKLEPLEGPSYLPTSLRESTQDMRELWLALTDQLTHPVARARVFDIVFTLRLMANSRDAAERAARAYLDAVGGSQRAQVQANGVVRAWTLARSVGLATLEQEINAVMLGMVEDLLDRDEHPYAVVPMLCALISPSRGKTAEDIDLRVDALLDRTLHAYPQTHVIKDVAAVVRKRAAADAARVEDANRVLINAMMAEADAAVDPLVIRTHLADAASEARRWNIKDLEDDAIARLQTAPKVQWESVEFGMTVPAPLFDLYMPGFDQATDWQEALNIWFNTSAPSGNLQTNVETTRQVLDASVFHQILTTIVFRDGDLPARKLADQDDVFMRELARTEARQMNIYGLILARGLHEIRFRFGIPTQNELAEFLGSTGTHLELAKALATAIQLYWVELYDASTHMAAPKVEPAVRAVLLKLNEPIYKAAVGDTSGQFPGLGVLLDRLEQLGLNHDWLRFLRTFLLADGYNVRNLVAHGYLNNIGYINAALAVMPRDVVPVWSGDGLS